eukprot:3209050-Amphidinium_carterae.2
MLDHAHGNLCVRVDTEANMCSIELGRGLIAPTLGLSEGTYVKTLLCELLDFDAGDRVSIPLHVHTDSEAARCIAFRTGVIFKVKHLGIRVLHCQQVFDEGQAHLLKGSCYGKPSRLVYEAG